MSPAVPRVRLDVLLVERGLIETRSRAQALIMAGQVYVDGAKTDKPGTKVREDVPVEVRGADMPVSRGADKLRGGWQRLGLDAAGKVALDAGASTGGFTEVLLAEGAAAVHAVDVGYGQLAWKLREDPRVHVHERTNLRLLEPGALDPRPEVLVMDVSFISVVKLLPALAGLLVPGAAGLVLVKPQFEAGPDRVGKGGVVRDPEVHRAVLGEVRGGFLAAGWGVTGACPSPLRGAKGNVEFFFRVVAPGAEAGPEVTDADLAAVVAEATGG